MARLWAPAIKDNPLAFVLFAFPWQQPGTPLEHFKGPRKWQREVLTEIANHIKQNQGKIDYDTLRHAVSSGRGIGKSALVSWITIWMLSTRIGSTTIISANSESQLRSVTWAEITKWLAMSLNSHWFEVSATRLMPAKWITELVERDLKKGTRYWGVEGRLWSAENPDAYAGVHNFDGVLVIFDEASGIDDSIWAVTAGFFTENTPNRFWMAFSNPRRNTGYFYETFNSKRGFWTTKVVDARTVEGTDKAVYQSIIDEYISSAEQKWGQYSGVVLLLPHGYEGQGPDHSSARIERYLQLCAQNNMTVAQPSTPASHFHLLRRQAYSQPKRPLIVFTPKAMLRLRGATSSVEDFTNGVFQPVLDDHSVDGQTRRILLHSGKIHYDLLAEREKRAANGVALVRMEQFYPFPELDLAQVLTAHQGAELVWVQDEPENQGAWPFIALELRRLGIDGRVVCRPAAASPAAGSSKRSAEEHAHIMDTAFAGL